jgi:hypothetical protein
MRLNILLIVLVVLLAAGMMLMVSNVRSQHKEILSLRNRVENLELIISHEFHIPKKTVPSGQI